MIPTHKVLYSIILIEFESNKVKVGTLVYMGMCFMYLNRGLRKEAEEA